MIDWIGGGGGGGSRNLSNHYACTLTFHWELSELQVSKIWKSLTREVLIFLITQNRTI